LAAGETKEYIYPNQRPTTGWYHDHALHITLDNAYHGLAGFYLMSSKLKHGSCGEPFNLEVRDSVVPRSVAEPFLCHLLNSALM